MMLYIWDEGGGGRGEGKIENSPFFQRVEANSGNPINIHCAFI